jgi:acetyltransferase-like isoleucine patch superfamily enzyme
MVYRRLFDIDADPIIEQGVWLSRTRGMPGRLRIGKRVLLAHHVAVDYSGDVEIEDDVRLSEGAEVHPHQHPLDASRVERGKTSIIPTRLVLRQGCWVGAHAIILPQAQEIGKNAVVGAGAVVTSPVPANTIVGGNPARVIRMIGDSQLKTNSPVYAADEQHIDVGGPLR